jgi:hypothetical protein
VDRLLEPAEVAVRDVGEEVPADSAGRVRQPVGERAGRGVEQEPRRLDAERRDDHHVGGLPPLDLVLDVDDPVISSCGPSLSLVTRARRISAPAKTAFGTWLTCIEDLARLMTEALEDPEHEQRERDPAPMPRHVRARRAAPLRRRAAS